MTTSNFLQISCGIRIDISHSCILFLHPRHGCFPAAQRVPSVSTPTLAGRSILRGMRLSGEPFRIRRRCLWCRLVSVRARRLRVFCPIVGQTPPGRRAVPRLQAHVSHRGGRASCSLATRGELRARFAENNGIGRHSRVGSVVPRQRVEFHDQVVGPRSRPAHGAFSLSDFAGL